MASVFVVVASSMISVTLVLMRRVLRDYFIMWDMVRTIKVYHPVLIVQRMLSDHTAELTLCAGWDYGLLLSHALP